MSGAFLEPLFLIMVMTRFHVCAQGQPIDLEWDARLSNLSDKFADLKDRIASAEPSPSSLSSQQSAG